MIKLLTQDHCSQCVALKLFLEKGLRGQYDQYIEVVKREDKPEEFMELVQAHQISATPALIGPNGILRDCKVSLVKDFLDQNI